MSDGFERPAILAAVPVGARDFGLPDLSLAMLPCLGPAGPARRFPLLEDL